MNSGPRTLVSIVMITRDRREVVLASLDALSKQTYRQLEVVVVDNASTDGTAEAIESRFPNHILIRRSDGSPTAGRNAGYEKASGDLLISLDDDIEFWDGSAVDRLVDLAASAPQVGAFAFRVTDPTDSEAVLPEHWWHGRPLQHNAKAFLTDYFPEGAVMFRRSLIEKLGGYETSMFRGAENVELSLRMIKAGLATLYCPTVAVAEKVKRGMHYRSPRSINYLTLRNRLWAARLHLPLASAAWYSATRIGAAFVRAARHGWLRYWFQGVVEGLRPPREIKERRQPLLPEEARFRRRLRAGIDFNP